MYTPAQRRQYGDAGIEGGGNPFETTELSITQEDRSGLNIIVAIVIPVFVVLAMVTCLMKYARATRSSSEGKVQSPASTSILAHMRSLNPPIPARVNPTRSSRQPLTQQEILDRSIRSSSATAPTRVAVPRTVNDAPSASSSSSSLTLPVYTPDNRTPNPPEAQAPSTNTFITRDGLVAMEWGSPEAHGSDRRVENRP
ncbi:hypothetical protein BKA70DRAFT_1234860 [Coprinopsis sp. MPI-PUGE-AT-0042]|nr:hypothetical protein BKA70DRAFT_1234860 [Coprinopsis sp. MPI-PUGE-AT-0042]